MNGAIDAEFIDRICAYMIKGVKEARVETNWLKPDNAYEDSIEKFIRNILNNKSFISYTQKFVTSIEIAGAINSLTASTLKILGPGVPDIYQGSDMWSFSLVDPDNRRPVDFKMIKEFPPKITASDWKSADFKRWYTHKLLQIRHKFLGSALDMKPISVSGGQNDQIIAYHWNDLIVVCPRYFGHQPLDKLSLAIEGYLELEEGAYQNLMTEDIYNVAHSLPINNLFSEHPIAILKPQS